MNDCLLAMKIWLVFQLMAWDNIPKNQATTFLRKKIQSHSESADRDFLKELSTKID